MKILGKTGNGYLVEATATELSNAAGYLNPYQTPGYCITDSYTKSGEFPIGQIIEATVAHSYLNVLRQAEERVRASELTLRALADLLSKALPTTAIPPENKDLIDGN
jgi:hypothetical protein